MMQAGEGKLTLPVIFLLVGFHPTTHRIGNLVAEK